MSRKKIYHVSPAADGRWEVRPEGGRPESVHQDQAAAFNRAQELAPEDGEIRIHEPAGKDWRLAAAERAMPMRIRGEKAVPPTEVLPVDEVPRGVEALEEEGERARVTDADGSPTVMGPTARTPAELQENNRRQEHK